MKWILSPGLILLVLLAGCKPRPSATVAAEPSLKTYEAHGIVRNISPDRRTVAIQHDAIPGFMPAMTMDFAVAATNELNGIAPGDEINFELIVGPEESRVRNVRFLSHRIEVTTNHTVVIHEARSELGTGDLLPDYEFLSETGSKIQISDFRGRALAFTFFFTRCPLPEYCPRMSQDFAEARQLLQQAPGAPSNWQFLSISFDPEIDQPAVLASYAGFFRQGNADRWLFACASSNTLAALAPKLDLMVRREEGGITHNLRTVVLDPDGRIFRQFDGNEWLPEKLAEAMLAAARRPTNAPAR